MSLRTALRACMTAIVFVVPPAVADNFPSRPVKIIVPAGAGGPADIQSRALAAKIGERLGQPVVIENRPGAAGTLALANVAKSAPDGYTMVWISETNAGAESLYPGRQYNLLQDFAPVGMIGMTGLLLVINPAIPARNVREFIGHASERPGRLSYVSGGNGNLYHLVTEKFAMATGTHFTHVPYSQVGVGRTDLISGQVQFMFDAIASMQPHVVSGKVRALGVSTSKRASTLPNLPTIGETVPGFVVNAWSGFSVPANTPATIVTRLQDAIEFAVTDKDVRSRFDAMGTETAFEPSRQFGDRVKQGVEQWGDLIRTLRVKVD